MSYPNLHLMLQAANRRAMFIALTRVALIGISLFLAGLLLALVLDAIFALASWGLIAWSVIIQGLEAFTNRGFGVGAPKVRIGLGGTSMPRRSGNDGPVL